MKRFNLASSLSRPGQGLQSSSVHRCRGCSAEEARASGCRRCSTSQHNSDSPGGGHFLPKVPPPPPFAVNAAQSETRQPGGTLLPSIFPSAAGLLLPGQASAESQDSQSLSSKRQQTRAIWEKWLLLSPVSLVCGRLAQLQALQGEHPCSLLLALICLSSCDAFPLCWSLSSQFPSFACSAFPCFSQSTTLSASVANGKKHFKFMSI